eukprot:m.756481 g.756481  ORF g.756481 m.756481 type:complete len:296 (-) comp23184_c0_seq7:2781-3668(-)
MEQHGIDLVVHGYASNADAKRQAEFFAPAMDLGKFQRIDYHTGESTSDIIRRIQALQRESIPAPIEARLEHSQPAGGKQSKPQWFGAAVAAATGYAATIATSPMSPQLQQTIEPHVRKAAVRRDDAIAAVREATGAPAFDSVWHTFNAAARTLEGDFSFNPRQYSLREAFLEAGGQPLSTDLTRLHEQPTAKDSMMQTLTETPTPFHAMFDKFVREVCAPKMASLVECQGDIYYQGFPCIRVVQPGEFSIGPHADVAYGLACGNGRLWCRGQALRWCQLRALDNGEYDQSHTRVA